jgi:ribosomal protein S7
MQILKSIQRQDQKLIIITQLSIIKSITNWIVKLARKHVVNETVMQLCCIIINDHNKKNPLRTWGDASWFYTWIEGIEGF